MEKEPNEANFNLPLEEGYYQRIENASIGSISGGDQTLLTNRLQVINLKGGKLSPEELAERSRIEITLNAIKQERASL